MQRKYCILCEDWTTAEFVVDDETWWFECGHEVSKEAQVIVDRNFEKLYHMDA